MTSLEVYGLITPFVIAALGWAFASWQLKVVEKHRRTHRQPIVRAAE